MKVVHHVDVITGIEFQPIAEKQAVLDYMNNGQKYCASARMVRDRVTGELTGIEDNWKTDGVFCWSSDTIYHFQRYNAPLLDGFIEHVVKN